MIGEEPGVSDQWERSRVYDVKSVDVEAALKFKVVKFLHHNIDIGFSTV